MQPKRQPHPTSSTALHHVAETDTQCSRDETSSPTEQVFGESIAAD